MKVNKKLNSKRCQKSLKNIFGLKDCRVNLTKLSKERIQRYLVGSTGINYNCNIHFKINRDGDVVAVRESGTKVPMTITITEFLDPKPSYNLRATSTKTGPNEAKKVGKCSAVAVISVSVRKNQLWNQCKKTRDESKIVESSIVFAKQV